MNKVTQYILAITVMLGASLANAETVSNGKYTCKSFAGEVCAVNNSTGQCTASWDDEDGGNPMFFCKKFIGIKVSNYDKSNFYCKDMGGYVCAKSLKTGQCTNSWDNEHGNPMHACQSFLGVISTKVDKSNFTCKKTSIGYCAQSLKTGQCTNEWSDQEGGNAKFQCNNWLTK